jgi:hypothetical protein
MVGELVGEGAAQEQAVVGETPNLAARLQALAEPGCVGAAETKHKKRRKAAGSRARVSDGTDVSDGEASPGHTSSPNGADGPGQAADQAPCCAQCGLPIDADEGSAEIAGKLYHSPDCSRWAGHRPEVRGRDG